MSRAIATQMKATRAASGGSFHLEKRALLTEQTAMEVKRL
jgi:hypothetical protein